MKYRFSKIRYEAGDTELLKNISFDSLKSRISESLKINQRSILAIESTDNNYCVSSWRPFIGWNTPEDKISITVGKRLTAIKKRDLIGLHAIHNSSSTIQKRVGRILITDAEMLEGETLNPDNIECNIIHGLDSKGNDISIPLNEVTLCNNAIIMDLSQDSDPLGSFDITDQVLKNLSKLIRVPDVIEDTNYKYITKPVKDIIKQSVGTYYEERNSSLRVSFSDSLARFFGTQMVENQFDPIAYLLNPDYKKEAKTLIDLSSQYKENTLSSIIW